jgi:hypothetical protein
MNLDGLDADVLGESSVLHQTRVRLDAEGFAKVALAAATEIADTAFPVPIRIYGSKIIFILKNKN